MSQHPSTVDAERTPSPPRGCWPYALAAVAVVAVVYVATLAALPLSGFWIVDNGCKFIQMESILRSDYADYSIDWPGAEVDPKLAFNPLGSRFGHVRDGKLYGTFAPFFPMLSTFPYRLWGVTGLYVVPLLGGLLTLTAVWKLAREFRVGESRLRWSPALAVLLAGLATPIWEHTPATGLACWSFVCFVRWLRDPRLLWSILAGLLCAGSIYFRDDLYVFAAVMALFMVIAAPRSWGHAIAFGVFAGLGLIPLWYFQWKVLGNPLGHHFAPSESTAGEFAQFVADRWLVLRHIFFDVCGSLPGSLLFTAPLMVLWLRRVFARSNPKTEAEPVGGVGLLELTLFGLLGGGLILCGQVLAPSQPQWLLTSNSLFAASPILILAFLKLRSAPDNQSTPGAVTERTFRLVWGFLLVYAVLYAMLTPEIHAKGVHWGCRYLLTFYPIVSAIAAHNMVAWWSCKRGAGAGNRLLPIALIVLSVGAQLHSVCLMGQMKAFWVRLNATVKAEAEAQIVTNVWWIPMTLSDCFFDRSIYQIDSDEAFRDLRRKLSRRGVRKLTIMHWPPRPDAEARGNKVVQDGLGMFAAELDTIRLP